MRFLVLLSLLGLALASAPNTKAVDALAKNLKATWGNRLSDSDAMSIATKQLQWLVDNRNTSTQTINFRETEPMLSSCAALPKRSAPASITDLHPQDIKVIGAIGDSVSTGCNALSTSWLNMKDYEGLAWSMGGDDGAVTLPNIFSDYAELVAPAHGIGGDNKGFNFAKNGAVVQDTPGQAAALVAAIKNHPGVNFDNDWKVVTVLIGGNNLCDVCQSDKESENNAAAYEKHLTQTLTILSSMPRTFVNLVSHTDYTQIAKYKGFFCGIALEFVCHCLSTTNSGDMKRTKEEIGRFNAVNDKLAPQFRRDDFAVIVQTGLVNAIIPDDSYISDADCFHPSGEGQRLFSTALWNSMIRSSTEKKGYIANVNDAPRCADEHTLLHVD